MMHFASSRSALQYPMEDTSKLKKQLQREITCLEMQLERLRRFDQSIDNITLRTYEEMITSRQEMLLAL